MLGDRCLGAGRLLGQEGGCVASRGCDAGRQVSCGWEVVRTGGRMCG
jgi:hypothetical protein